MAPTDQHPKNLLDTCVDILDALQAGTDADLLHYDVDLLHYNEDEPMAHCIRKPLIPCHKQVRATAYLLQRHIRSEFGEGPQPVFIPYEDREGLNPLDFLLKAGESPLVSTEGYLEEYAGDKLLFGIVVWPSEDMEIQGNQTLLKIREDLSNKTFFSAFTPISETEYQHVSCHTSEEDAQEENVELGKRLACFTTFHNSSESPATLSSLTSPQGRIRETDEGFAILYRKKSIEELLIAEGIEGPNRGKTAER